MELIEVIQTVFTVIAVLSATIASYYAFRMHKAKVAISSTLPSRDKRLLLREWWHSVLRSHGKYPCYAVFLGLPSDEQLIQYLIDYGREIDLISGENCLVLALSKSGIQRSSVVLQRDVSDDLKIQELIWKSGVNEYVTGGYSVDFALFFEIGFEDFPCIIFFDDIRSAQHVVVSLKDMQTKEIIQRMRWVFSIIARAVRNNKNPLDAIENYKNKEIFLEKGETVISELRGLAGKSLEKAIEVWISARFD